MKENKPKWIYSKITVIEPINRKEAKHYAKNCEICKEYYDSKEKLFLLGLRTFKTEEDLKKGVKNTNNFTNDYHIFTLTALYKKLDNFMLIEIREELKELEVKLFNIKYPKG